MSSRKLPERPFTVIASQGGSCLHICCPSCDLSKLEIHIDSNGNLQDHRMAYKFVKNHSNRCKKGRFAGELPSEFDTRLGEAGQKKNKRARDNSRYRQSVCSNTKMAKFNFELQTPS